MSVFKSSYVAYLFIAIHFDLHIVVILKRKQYFMTPITMDDLVQNREKCSNSPSNYIIKTGGTVAPGAPVDTTPVVCMGNYNNSNDRFVQGLQINRGGKFQL